MELTSLTYKKNAKNKNITKYVSANNSLSSVIFETEDRMFATVRDGLLKIAEFWWHEASKIFDTFQLKDMVVYGDMVTYLYNQHSEVSIGIVADIPHDTLPYLEDINLCFIMNELDYKFINRPIHCRFVSEISEGMPCYSLQNNKWIYKPQKKELPLSPQEFVEGLEKYQKQIHDFVKNLPKHENKRLTLDSCKELEQHMKHLHRQAHKMCMQSSEHEYNLDYLYYRAFREIGGTKFFAGLLSDSYKYNINVLEEC